MRQQSPSPDGQGEQRDLMAPLLPDGEPVESLLRKAQFFTPGEPSQDYRELHLRAGGEPRSSTGSGGGTTGRCVPPTA